MIKYTYLVVTILKSESELNYLSFSCKKISNTQLNNKTDSTNLGKHILIFDKFYHIHLYRTE